MICVDDHLLHHNVMFPLLVGLHDGIHLLIISGVYMNSIKECLLVIGCLIPLLGEDCPNSILVGICLNQKWLLQV